MEHYNPDVFHGASCKINPLEKFMSKKQISKEKARKLVKDYLASLIGIASITDQKPSFGSIYGSWSENEVWYVHPAGDRNMIGGSRIVIISNSTGKILTDQIIGE